MLKGACDGRGRESAVGDRCRGALQWLQAFSRVGVPLGATPCVLWRWRGCPREQLLQPFSVSVSDGTTGVVVCRHRRGVVAVARWRARSVAVVVVSFTHLVRSTRRAFVRRYGVRTRQHARTLRIAVNERHTCALLCAAAGVWR